MYDRIERLLAEKATAAADGMPLAARIHGACNDLAALLMQARDRLMTHGLPGVAPKAPRDAASPFDESKDCWEMHPNPEPGDAPKQMQKPVTAPKPPMAAPPGPMAATT